MMEAWSPAHAWSPWPGPSTSAILVGIRPPMVVYPLGEVVPSDTLHELTAGDVAILRALGLATIVDLRTSAELERTGRGPLGPEPIAYHHLSVIRDEGRRGDGRSRPGGGGPLRAVPLVPGRRAEPLMAALALVARSDNLPLVFHCAAGRTAPGSWPLWSSTSSG